MQLHELRKIFPLVETKTLHKLLMHILAVEDLSQLLTKNFTLTQSQLKTLTKNIHDHSQGKPLEYITGICNFYGMNFSVNESTLIPRIETELLVEMAIGEIGNRAVGVLDLCTGSGVIALSVAKHCPNAKVTAVDVCPNALTICKQNATKFNLGNQVQIVQADILKHIPQGHFNLILSNPPYIETETIPTLSRSVKDFEPHLALDGGSDGLIFYKKIYQYASSIKNSVFILEIGFNQGNAVYEIFKEFSPKVIKDYNGNNRMVRFEV